MSDHAAKRLIYAQFAHLAKALASPARIEILDLLAQAERAVEDLAAQVQLTVANTSAHLQVLARAHLVLTRKEGNFVYYRLADPSVYQLWNALRTTAERQLADIDRLVTTYFQERATLVAISGAELAERLRDPATVIIDVRPVVEYQYGHIAGARSFPLAELAQRVDELPPDAQIIAYCRGPYCVFADEAVAMLHERGFQAVRYADGYPAWAAAGQPIETGTSSSRSGVPV
jgi:rhodanese-related sulfurtransferase/DNA-binding transcriptional ArsR family regulator